MDRFHVVHVATFDHDTWREQDFESLSFPVGIIEVLLHMTKS